MTELLGRKETNITVTDKYDKQFILIITGVIISKIVRFWNIEDKHISLL